MYNELKAALRAAGLVNSFTVIREEDGVLVTRDLGNWQVPAGEEDDGDYDWEEPTPETYAKIQQVKAQFPGLCIDWSEKNYIDFRFEKV